MRFYLDEKDNPTAMRSKAIAKLAEMKTREKEMIKKQGYRWQRKDSHTIVLTNREI